MNLATAVADCSQVMALEKWYLDATFPDGRVWIGYHARLQLWGPLCLYWASGSEFHPDGRQTTVARWAHLPSPHNSEDVWTWTGPDRFQAAWHPTVSGTDLQLANEDDFEVGWNCLMPKATVTVSGLNHNGNHAHAQHLPEVTGYVEHLRVKFGRSGVPFKRLLWGRAHVGEHSLVWIHWSEGRDLSVLFQDGRRVEGLVASEPQGGGIVVETERGQWEAGSAHILCDRNVRDSFPRLLLRLTGGIAPLRETKCSGPVKFRNGTGEDVGTGIWEEVRW